MRIDSSAAEGEPDVGFLDPTHPHIRATDAWIADCYRAAKPERNSVMRIHTIVIAGASLMAFVSIAKADDHLFEATQHGLTPGSQPFQPNPNGRGGDLAPGQGSPFAGIDIRTPATDTEAANLHANGKLRYQK